MKIRAQRGRGWDESCKLQDPLVIRMSMEGCDLLSSPSLKSIPSEPTDQHTTSCSMHVNADREVQKLTR